MSATSDITASEQPFADKRGHKPLERRCVACGEARDPALMVRYAVDPTGKMVVPDVFQKLGGRGVWVTADEASLRKAVKTGGFKRGFKTNVEVDADTIVEQTRQGLSRRLLGQMTMVRKAGRLVFGEHGVREAAASGDVGLRIEASDGAPDGRGKLRTLSFATARELERTDPPVIGCFTAEQIGQALGRDPVVHAAVKVGPMLSEILWSARRLAGFTVMLPQDWTDKGHDIPVEPPPKES